MGNLQSAPVHGLNDNSVWGIYRSIPPLTRTVMTSSLACLLAVETRLVQASSLSLDRNAVLRRYEVWRIVTNLVYFGQPSVSLVLNLLMLYQSLSSLETTGSMVLERVGIGSTLMTAIVLSTPRIQFPFLGSAMIMMVNSFWSFDCPHTTVNLYGIPLKNRYLPFALIVMNTLMGGSPLPGILGFLCALVTQRFVGASNGHRGAFGRRGGGLGDMRAGMRPGSNQWSGARTSTSTRSRGAPSWTSSAGYRIGTEPS